jgi:GNAT superfamily N-acetyltransferase
MSDPKSIGDILKNLLASPRPAKVLDAAINPEYPPIHLELLKPDHEVLFYDIVNDAEVRKYFQEFNDDKETILSKLHEVNDFPEVQEYWAIMEGSDMAGYMALKRSIPLHDILFSQPQRDVDDPDFLSFLDLTEEELRNARWKEREEKLMIAPYCLDLVVHRDFRRKRIASRAFELVLLKAENRGIREIYLEIHRDNDKSNNWVTGSLGAELIRSTDNLFYPAHVYRFRF